MRYHHHRKKVRSSKRTITSKRREKGWPFRRKNLAQKPPVSTANEKNLTIKQNDIAEYSSEEQDQELDQENDIDLSELEDSILDNIGQESIEEELDLVQQEEEQERDR